MFYLWIPNLAMVQALWYIVTKCFSMFILWESLTDNWLPERINIVLDGQKSYLDLNYWGIHKDK